MNFLGYHVLIAIELTVCTCANTTLYFANGSKARLVCPLLDDVITWTGPPNRHLIAAGKTAYKDDLRVIKNSNLFTLEISEFTEKKVGTYTCESTQTDYRFLLAILTPSYITIDDATSNGCIYGYVDRELNITCRVISGNPRGNVYWKYNNSVVQRSNSSSVTYSFQPSTAHNLGEYSCEANNSLLSQKNIKICLYLPPKVGINAGRFVSVVEGTQIKLKCIYSSNNAIKSISWAYDDKNVQKWFNSTQIQLVYIDWTQAGKYACTVTNQAGNDTAYVKTEVLRRPSAPTNIQTVALTNEIIVKWHAGYDGGLQQDFCIEYRQHLDVTWQILSAGEQSTFVISRLEPDTVYIVRMYSKNTVGESNRTDEIILATDKQRIEGTFILAIIPGIICLLLILSWVGKKGNETTCVRQRSHYDEIDSLYYNPMNDNIARQAGIQSQQPEAVQLENRPHLESMSFIIDLYHPTSQKIASDEDNSPNILQDNLSGRPSSEESYLVPCRKYIDLEDIARNELEENHRDQLDIDVENISLASESSETNAKSVKKYETLLPVNTNEHSYQ